MQLIVNGQFVDDPWESETSNPGEAVIPAPVLELAGPSAIELPVPFVARWFWRKTPGGAQMGIGVLPDTVPELLTDTEISFALIAIVFTTHADGRGFSLAHLLRERGYAGELRALGALIQDQYEALGRSGFDSIMLDRTDALRHTQADWSEAFAKPSQIYVPAWRADPASSEGAVRADSVLARRYARV